MHLTCYNSSYPCCCWWPSSCHQSKSCFHLIEQSWHMHSELRCVQNVWQTNCSPLLLMTKFTFPLANCHKNFCSITNKNPIIYALHNFQQVFTKALLLISHRLPFLHHCSIAAQPCSIHSNPLSPHEATTGHVGCFLHGKVPTCQLGCSLWGQEPTGWLGQLFCCLQRSTNKHSLNSSSIFLL